MILLKVTFCHRVWNRISAGIQLIQTQKCINITLKKKHKEKKAEEEKKRERKKQNKKG